MTIADDLTAPRVGYVGVLSISGAASAAQDMTPAGAVAGKFYATFIADVDWYIVFAGKSDATSLPAPVIATTGALPSGAPTLDGRCDLVPAKMPYHVEITPESRYFRVIASGAGTLRYRVSSPTA